MNAAFLIVMLLIGIACLLIWAQHKYQIFSSDPVDPIFPQQAPVAQPEVKYMDVKLSLPSKDVYFQFTCTFKVGYTATHAGMATLTPPVSSVESFLFSAAKEHSSKLALPQRDQLKHELDSAFRTERSMPNLNFRIWASCKEVKVDAKQLEAIERNYQEDLEADRLQRRVSYLSMVFENPRAATMWWLAQNVERIEELPDKAELLYRLDRRLHPDANPSELPVSRDLDWFLEGADDSQRSAIGVALAGIYRRYGRDDLAEEAERLIPNRTTPSRNGHKPEGLGDRIPSRPTG